MFVVAWDDVTIVGVAILYVDLTPFARQTLTNV